MSELEHAIYGILEPYEVHGFPSKWKSEKIAVGQKHGRIYKLVRLWRADEGREGGYNYAFLNENHKYYDDKDWGKAEDAIRTGEEMGIKWRNWIPELNAAMDAARTYKHTREEMERMITSNIDLSEMLWNRHLKEERPRPREIQLEQYEKLTEWSKRMIALYEKEYGEWTGMLPIEHNPE